MQGGSRYRRCDKMFSEQTPIFHFPLPDERLLGVKKNKCSGGEESPLTGSGLGLG
jgi:hypothetical protein